MQIKLNLQIFLFILIFILTHQIEIYGTVMIFAIIHELGHMIIGLILKLKPKKIDIMPFGISITFEDYGYEKLLEIKKVIIAFAGPIINIIIAIITYFMNIKIETKALIVYSNLLIAIFNLLPIYPLDGGRILRGFLKLNTGTEKVDLIINRVSNTLVIMLTVISSITILYFKNISILFVITYLWIIIIKENRKYSIKKKMYKILQTHDKTKNCIDI